MVLDEGHAVQPSEIGRCLSVVPLYKGRWWRPGDSEYRQQAHPIELVVLWHISGMAVCAWQEAPLLIPDRVHEHIDTVQ